MISTEILRKVLGEGLVIKTALKQLGLSNTIQEQSLSFLDDEHYLADLNENKNISAVITTPVLAAKIDKTKEIFFSEDPRWSYYTLYNYFAESAKKHIDTVISDGCDIHPSAVISAKNVVMGSGCKIYPNVTILEDVELGNDCIIQAGAVLGSIGFEYKRTAKGVLPVIHDGKVILQNRVEIGANSCVDKGFSYRNTEIGDDTKIDNLVHIGHAAHIGKRCLIAACAQIGAVNMEDDVWVGPNANLLFNQNIGKEAFITVGAVVTRDVLPAQKVTGNFALPHETFLRNLKNNR